MFSGIMSRQTSTPLPLNDYRKLLFLFRYQVVFSLKTFSFLKYFFFKPMTATYY